MDVRAALAAALRRLVRDPAEWPARDRRRFRNLLLDASTSDAMPLAELLLRAHDDGLLRALPDRSAPRAAWEAATARLAGDLQSQRFLEPGVARWVAEAWTAALGPDPVPVAKPAVSRAPAGPKLTARPAPSSAPRATAPSAPSPSNTAASIRAYQRSNQLMVGMLAIATLAMVAMFARASRRRGDAPPPVAATPAPAQDRKYFDVQRPPLAPSPSTAPAVPASAADSSVAAAVAPAPPESVVTPVPAPVATRDPVVIAPPARRTTDDVVLKSGRVVEGRVMSVRAQGIVVHDEATQLDFEIDRRDVERVVTRDGRVLRFGADEQALLGDEGDGGPTSFAGRLRVRYAARWGTPGEECARVAREFAPGTRLTVLHLRGAPMLKLEFAGGQGFNAAVRPDGGFESVSVTAPQRGPQDTFVQVRLSGRLTRRGNMDGVARLVATGSSGTVLCDLALTMHGEREAP